MYSPTGVMTSWRQGGRRCSLAGSTTSRQRVGQVLARWRDVELAARRMAVLASWLDDEAAAGRTMVLARWRDDKSAAGRTTGLARWHDDESAAGRTTGLARWRDDESAAGRKARGTPPACNHWRNYQQCLEQWEQDSLLPTARMLTEGLLARQ